MCSIRKVSSALGAPARSTNKPGLLGFHGVNSGGRLLHGLLAYHQTSNTTWCGGRVASKPYMPSNPAPDLLPHLSPQRTRKTFQTTISLPGSTRFSQCDQIIILPLFFPLFSWPPHRCRKYFIFIWSLEVKEKRKIDERGGHRDGEEGVNNIRVLLVCIWLSVALFPLLLYSVLWVQGLFSISIALFLPASFSLCCAWFYHKSSDTHVYTHTLTHTLIHIAHTNQYKPAWHCQSPKWL